MLQIVSHEEAVQEIIDSYENHLAPFFHGTFGIGKSSIVKKAGKIIAKNLGLTYSEDFNDMDKDDTFVVAVLPAHQLDVGDLKGIPFPNKERTSTEFLTTNYLPTKGKGIIFTDEIQLAAPMVQGNLYQIVFDRRLGTYTVPDGYSVVAAGNLAEDQAHQFEMANPLKNRFIHYKLEIPTVEEWVDNFALFNKVDHRIINFLKSHEQYLHSFDPKSDEDTMVFATPRSWEFASIAVANIDSNNYESIRRKIGGTVGAPIANMFTAWLKLSENYDIATIFKQKKIGKVPTKFDELYSLLSAIVSFYTKKSTEENACTILDLVKDFKKEHGTLLMSQIKHSDDEWFKKIKKGAPKKWSKIIEEYLPMLV